jgi:hypothetical protein
VWHIVSGRRTHAVKHAVVSESRHDEGDARVTAEPAQKERSSKVSATL